MNILYVRSKHNDTVKMLNLHKNAVHRLHFHIANNTRSRSVELITEIASGKNCQIIIIDCYHRQHTNLWLGKQLVSLFLVGVPTHDLYESVYQGISLIPKNFDINETTDLFATDKYENKLKGAWF